LSSIGSRAGGLEDVLFGKKLAKQLLGVALPAKHDILDLVYEV
jgi:hypothetical protein